MNVSADGSPVVHATGPALTPLCDASPRGLRVTDSTVTCNACLTGTWSL